MQTDWVHSTNARLHNKGTTAFVAKEYTNEHKHLNQKFHSSPCEELKFAHWARPLKLDDLTSKIGVNTERKGTSKNLQKNGSSPYHPPKKSKCTTTTIFCRSLMLIETGGCRSVSEYLTCAQIRSSNHGFQLQS